MKTLAPIALFVYQRLEQTQKTVQALQNNTLAKESDLFIFSDAPKNQNAAANVALVRKYIKSVSGFSTVTIIERAENFGLSRSIIDGVTTLVNRFGKIIVVEDDLLTAPFFLDFMNNGLERYESNDKIISIHAYRYPVQQQLPSTFFLYGADCWGWGTWKRGWTLFQPDGNLLMNELKAQHREKEFDFNGTYPYTKMLKHQIQKKNDSWAIRWYASAFLAKKLTLYPGISLVTNISSDQLGTHTQSLTEFHSDLAQSPIPVEDIPIEDSRIARKAFEEFFKSIQQPILARIAVLLRSLFIK